MTQDTQIGMACPISRRKVDVISGNTGYSVYKYDIYSNTITCGPKDHFETFQIISSTSDNIDRIQNMDLVANLYKKTCSQWDNDINIYREQIQNLVESNGLIANMRGIIGVLPGCSATLNIKKRISDGLTNNTDEAKYQMEKFNRIAKGWIVSGVVTMVNPSQNIFKQNVRLMNPNK